MKADREGVEKLRLAIERVAADLPPAERAGLSEHGVVRTREPVTQRPNRRAILAAGIVLSLLGYPAFLGLFRLPPLEEENAKLRLGEGEISAAAGPRPAGLHVLPLPRRPNRTRAVEAPADVDRILLRDDEPLLLLIELDPEWIEGGEETEAAEYLLEIVRPRDEGRWSSVFKSSQVERDMSLYEGIPLLISPAELSAGRYRLRFMRRKESADEEISATVFEIDHGR